MSLRRSEESIQINVMLEGRCAGNGPILPHKLEAQFLHRPVRSRITGEGFAPESLQAEPIEIESDGLSAERNSEACLAKILPP